MGAVVVFAGSGSGSGVLISTDGYILTNHHVAGKSGRVRIRWSDGTESVGEVVRADRRRDVALIKVASPKGRPLSIRQAPVELGDTVYAIGTPLGDELQNTVTRGIVSAIAPAATARAGGGDEARFATDLARAPPVRRSSAAAGGASCVCCQA